MNKTPYEVRKCHTLARLEDITLELAFIIRCVEADKPFNEITGYLSFQATNLNQLTLDRVNQGE